MIESIIALKEAATTIQQLQHKSSTPAKNFIDQSFL